MTQRQKQVESLLQRAVASALQRGLADPRLQGVLVSVTRVDVSPDLRNAKTFVSITPEKYESRAIHGLKDATMHIQQQVKKNVALRSVPHLRFEIDHDLKKQAAILEAIDQGMKRTEASSASTEQPNPEAAEHSDNAPDTDPTTPQEN
ncbi:30S ribosome-binding factor RbfA [Algisphaera agarilytica]|uniref:Ribosome-binding factor A n=1 Tax=Algisphaera agarilytica TaxID=1385975 RepID=A0A7X0H5S8_9BACT|nr:30S ribosome-binding factor RbfA [Algisphaera agarilytica]MBB6428646.1 ribosome-binding factor A [Algisphaera agarilytica]